MNAFGILIFVLIAKSSLAVSVIARNDENDAPNTASNTIDNYFNGEECQLDQTLKDEIAGYQPTVNKIIDAVVNGKFKGDTYKSLLELTDNFGSRISGSQNLEQAIDFMIEEFKEAGLENVHTEDAEVIHWVRGLERAQLVKPRVANLPVLGLGRSIATPEGGIEADVVAVETFDELESLPDDKVKGRIVVFVPSWMGYGNTVTYRSRGAAAAAKKGGIASLIRSASQFSIGSPHTGSQNYESNVPQIPTASITVEDAEMILRLYRKGENVRIKLELDDKNMEPVNSRNTIGELQGTGPEKNKSVVVVSGHLVSWDVGVGAMDDSGGVFISWKSLQYLKDLGLRPKRTIRAIAWTGEEVGYLGARAYEAEHKENEAEEFNMFMESDTGTFTPYGLAFSGNEDAQCIFREILNLMTPLNATKMEVPSSGGPDISVWVNKGFPGASLLNANERYFWFHHTAGDSMLVEDTAALDQCTALFASAAYIIADLSIDIPKDVKRYESAKQTLPYAVNLPILGLGYSVGTPRGGIIGQVVAVETFDELHGIPDDVVKGKIVVFAQKWAGYGPTVVYRSRGAIEAAKKGAAAALIRSATPFSIGSPHTGMMTYEEGVKKIPGACITIEDAERILRLYRRGINVTIHLEMEARNLGPVTSRNTIGELIGSQNRNDSVVVLSGHLDSWDVGVGAMDDGGGAFISWKALQYLKEIGIRSKRTLRAILWTGEEFGLLGARAYQEQHRANAAKEFNFFFESDIGTFEPLGLDFTGNKDAECVFKEILNLMSTMNTTKFNSPADGGPDISVWTDQGFPGASLLNKNEQYFWFHHSAGDSILLEHSDNLDKSAALFAAAAYVIADLSVDIPKNVIQ